MDNTTPKKKGSLCLLCIVYVCIFIYNTYMYIVSICTTVGTQNIVPYGNFVIYSIHTYLYIYLSRNRLEPGEEDEKGWEHDVPGRYLSNYIYIYL